MKLAALAFALSSLALFAERDTAIYRGKLTSDLNANGNRITSVGLPLDAGDAANKEYVDAHGGCDTNAVDILANSAVVTNALTVATTNRVAALETATNNLSSCVSSLASSVSGLASSVSGLESTKADRPALPVTEGNFAALTADGNLKDSGKTASDFAPAVDGGYLPLNDGGHVIGDTTFLGNFYAGPLGDMIGVTRDAGYLYKYDSEGIKWYYGYMEDANEIAVKGDIASAISATNPTFSNAVLAVQISTNDFAALYALKEAFADLPIDPVTGGISIGALLAALASAAAWLKKNKVGSFESVGGATATVENGVAKLDDFFTNSNSLLVGTISANSARLALDEDGEIIVTMNTED